MVLSCKKDNPLKPGYGVDGVTPMPDAVDIGLVVNGKRILWASFNLGASKEYEYGDYYAWGETSTYYETLEPLVWRKRNGKTQGYNWGSYLYCNGGDYRKITKYCPDTQGAAQYWDKQSFPEGADGRMVLLPSDDVAHKKLGGFWRMPTKEEWEALVDICYQTIRGDTSDYIWEDRVYATDENGNRVKNSKGVDILGYRIICKKTGGSLFFPCGGMFVSDNVPSVYYGDYSLFWSSSVYLAPNGAYAAGFGKQIYAGGTVSSFDRPAGLSIRPVKTLTFPYVAK